MPYLAVDEARRTLLPAPAHHDATAIKSFDFVVYGRSDNLILDVKGRKVTRPPSSSGRWSTLQNWVTREDVESLRAWRTLFGEGFEAAFVFVYWCAEQPPDGLFQEVFAHRDRWYAVRTVSLPDYEANMRVRSERWGSVHGPCATSNASAAHSAPAEPTTPPREPRLHPRLGRTVT